MFIGSEGTLGVISRAWMRLQLRPKFRAGASVRFHSFFGAARALRAIAQAGLYPSNCRILDAQEAFNTGAADGSVAIMVLGFESGDHAPDAWMARALECCAEYGGTPEAAKAGDAHLEGAAGIWRNAFIRMSIRTGPRPIFLSTHSAATVLFWSSGRRSRMRPATR
jgi:alkyldihydroxyacetonephosphate synthase